MNHITIIIPTRTRMAKLLRCLSSIPQHDWLTVAVGVDADPQTAILLTSYFAMERPGDITLLSRRHIGSMGMCNLLAPLASDGLFLAVDDIRFRPGCLEAAREEFNQAFPDDDGVLVVNQEGVEGVPAGGGFHLMGRVFQDRYPQRRPFCPAYWHFGDLEVGILAESLGKLRQGSPLVTVMHFHPHHHPGEMDQTHEDARKYKEQDQALLAARRKKGLIWGGDGTMG